MFHPGDGDPWDHAGEPLVTMAVKQLTRTKLLLAVLIQQ